jgi:hypothetical protein
MNRLSNLRAGGARERGGVLVMAALFAPVAILLVAFVLDVSRSWWHQRHLQVQADAAALAAAPDVLPCSSSLASDTQLYGGVTSTSYNQQVEGTAPANIHQLINSTKFYDQPSPVDNTVNTSPPCQSMMVDVKMTETQLPWYMKVFKTVFDGTPLYGVPYINAQARVEIREEQTTGPGDMPVAVNDVRFLAAEAFFVDTASGKVVGVAPLSQAGTLNGLAQWSNSGSPYSLTVPVGSSGTSGSDVGVRIALSGANNLTGNMTTDCATAGVMCYDSGSPTAQLLDVHGYRSGGTGSPAAPIARQVMMTPGDCGDQYFTLTTSSCTQGVQARLDLGVNPPLTGSNAVTVTIGSSKTKLACTYDGTSKLTTCTGSMPITAGSGRNQVDLAVAQGKSTVPIPNAQSTYAGTLDGSSGPIQALSLYADGIGDTSSLQQGTTHSIVIDAGVTPGLQVAQSVKDQPTTLRFSGTGSQNQSVTCTPVSIPPSFDSWGASLATGCQGPFQLNTTLTCPDNNSPVDCVQPATGNQQNKVAKALNYRILGSTTPTACTSPNHWSSYPSLPRNDPRIVTAFITPYGSFSGSGGSSWYPIQYFAAFYVTGWQDSGNGFTNPCQAQGQGDDPAQAGTIVGHFITYLNTLSTGGGSTTCVPNAINECTAVLTR